MEIPTLAQKTGITERSLRRAIEAIHKRGGQLACQDGRITGAHLPCFLATLYDLQVSFPPDKRPTIADHFFTLNQRPAHSWVIPETWPKAHRKTPVAPQVSRNPASHNAEPTEQPASLLRVMHTVQELERRVAALEERLARVNKALTHIELVLEDEDADNNLYNILVNHIGAFNARLTTAEQNWQHLTGIVAGAMVKLADDDREIRNLLKELLHHLSPR